jgi:Family of unknown function (DUF6600)
MKKILFALSMLAFAVFALPQARGADVSIDFFYNNLSGGNWIDVEGYGYAWQPDLAVSDPNWRPYSDGYWAYTDYGWTWISYEDFGWATYHYGRWANLADYGWVWIPGEDLDWGPAWVSWRTGGDYIGWAPLPPRGPGVVYEGQPISGNVDVTFDIGPEYYNFCDVRFIGEPVLRDRIFPPVQNVTYITNTVNVTNITVQNNVVYNYGPDFNVVNRYSSRPIQRLTIERQAPANLTTAVKSGTLTKVQGNKLLVAAPQKLAKAPPTAKPPAVKTKVAQPKIEHGWKGVPNKSELEQKIKAENPKNIPPPTRAAAREGGSPLPSGGGTTPAGAERGAAATPGARGRAGRVAPGGTVAPSLGESPSRVEREKGRTGARPRPGATTMPGEGPGRVSPQPFERGKPGGQNRSGITPPPPGPREGTAPSELGRERGKGRARPGERSPGPGPAAGGPTGEARATPRSALENAPAQQQERGRQPARRPGEEPNRGGSQQVPPQQGERMPERQRFGTPPPMGAGEREQRGGGQPGFRQQVTPPTTGGGPAGEARGQRERAQGAYGQPPQQQQQQPPPPQQQQQLQQQERQRGGAPGAAERGQAQGRAQPEGGNRRQPKETPPPPPR